MNSISGKSVILRVDWNLSLCGNESSPGDIGDTSKVMKSVTIVRRLFQYGAENVHIITHQGRPGSSSFTSTELHSKVLAAALEPYGIEVRYAGDFDKGISDLRTTLESQEKGHVYVWDNIRNLDYELNGFKHIDLFESDAGTVSASIEEAMEGLPLVQAIVDNFEPDETVYINDAFAAHHRVNQMSIGPLGYFLRQKGYSFMYGPTFNDELSKINLLKREMNSTKTNFFFGGAKVKDYIKLIPDLMNSYPDSNVFASGPLALALLKYGEGVDIGEKNQKLIKEAEAKGRGEKLAAVYSRYRNRIHLPSSFKVIEDGGEVLRGEEVEKEVDSLADTFVVDIGSSAVEEYRTILMRRGSCVNLINGGCGFHEGGFVDGTLSVFEQTRGNGGFVAIVGGDANLTWNKHGDGLGEPDVRSMAGKAFLNAIVQDQIPLKRFMSRA